MHACVCVCLAEEDKGAASIGPDDSGDVLRLFPRSYVCRQDKSNAVATHEMVPARKRPKYYSIVVITL